MRVALLYPRWSFEGSVYFGCRAPHLPLELAYAQALLEAPGHDVQLIDAHLFALSLADVAAELAALEGGVDQPVLLDPAQAGELGRDNARPEVVPTAGQVDDLGRRPRDRRFDALLELVGRRHCTQTSGRYSF